MTKEEKKALLKQWKVSQQKKYILKKAEAKSLFNYLHKKLADCDCDHTLKYSLEWLKKKYDGNDERIAEIMEELNADGGFCDCEVLLNCYERYELE